MKIFALVLASMFCVAQAQDVGFLCVKAHPGRVGVFLDGKYLGPAANFRIARTYSVPAGAHEVKLIDPRYEELVTKVTITPGKKLKLDETLRPLPAAKPPFGTIRVQNPDKYAAVYVNGKFYGHVDEFSNIGQGIMLNPGSYVVTIEPASGPPVVMTANVEAKKTYIVR